MGELNPEKIAQRLYDLDLVSDQQFSVVRGLIGSHNGSASDFMQTLIRREILTNYQAERLLRGDRTGFYYGNYKVLYLVGTGTFARVFRAVEKVTGEIVAVKVLRTRHSDDPQIVERFTREGETGKSLRHPHIVPVYEVFSSRGKHYIAMEFVEGGNLREFIRVRKKLEPGEATRLASEIAAALDYAHGLGYCHRDLKMSNVLISSRGEAKLVDFGLAGKGEDESANPRTVDYAGLEKATGAPRNDPRSDIFFLGCIYYNLLTGEPPLEETKDRVQRGKRSRFTDIPPIHRYATNLPEFVTTVVGRAMQYDPERRYQTPGQMLSDLQNVAQHLRASEAADATRSGTRLAAGSGTGDNGPGGPLPTLMFVESNVRLQNMVRNGLKKSGFRVLVMSHPERALERFRPDAADMPDAVIFSTGDLGEAALEAFNQFAGEEHTANLPAVLLLGQDQADWGNRAELAENRTVLTMPVRFKQFREALSKVMAAAQEK